MTQGIYGVIHCDDYGHRGIIIPDGAEPDVDFAYGWFIEEEDALWMEVLNLNTFDFWRGHFYYNDSEGPEDSCEVECNTEEHLNIHWESNNGDGHYDCTHYDHVVNGVVVETIKHDYHTWQ